MQRSEPIRKWQHDVGNGIASVDISNNGEIIVVGTLNNQVVCLNRDGQEQWQQPVGNQAWRTAVSADGQMIVIGTGSTRPWNLSGRGLFCFAADGSQLWKDDLNVSIWGLALSKDGSTIAAATSDKHILLYDNRGHRLWQQDISGWEWNARAWCAALSYDGAVVAVGTADRYIRVLHKSGQLQTEYRTQGEVFATALSRDGTEIVAGDNRKQIYWLDQHGQLRWQAELEDKIWALAMTEDGDRVVVGAGERETHLRLFSQSGEMLWRRYVDGGVTNVRISQASQHIIAGTRTGSIYLFDLNGEVLHKANASEIVRDVAISTGGQIAAAVSEDGTVYGFELPLTSIDSPVSTPTDAEHIRLIPISTPRGMKTSETEEQLLGALFPNARELRIVSEFTDGRTATRVFQVRQTDETGVESLPTVVKVGPKNLIEQEWQATQRHVLDRLPGVVPVQNVPAYIDHNDGSIWGGLRYSQVGDGLFEAKSFSHYSMDASLRDLWHVLENRFFRQMRQLWESTQDVAPLTMQNSYDAILPVNIVLDLAQPMVDKHHTALDARQLVAGRSPLPFPKLGDLVQLENFIVTEIDLPQYEVTLNLPSDAAGPLSSYRVRLSNAQANGLIAQIRVDEPLPVILGRVTMTRNEALRSVAQMAAGGHTDLAAAMLTLPDVSDVRLPNPLHAVSQLLQRKGEAKFSTIHGDLNLRNVLIDPEARTAHIIDSAAARHDHVLHDLLRFERDLLTDVLARTLFQAGLPPASVHQLYRYVHCATIGEPHASGQFATPSELPAALHKVYVMLVIIRRTARDLLADSSQWDEYYAGLVIHLVGALKFKDLDRAPAGQQPKSIAFWAAATVCWLMEGNVDCSGIAWRFVDLARKDGQHVETTNVQKDDANDSGSSEQPPITNINTGGGTYVAGDVNTGGGNFVGRDQAKHAAFNLADDNAQGLTKISRNNASQIGAPTISLMKIFVSYAWGGESEKTVAGLEVVCQQNRIPFIRDKHELRYKDSITKFMDQIGEGEAVIIIISDKYLKSPNCMYELTQIEKHGQFYERIFPIVLGDAKIRDPVERLSYVEYWTQKTNELEGAMQKGGTGVLDGQPIIEELSRYTRIKENVASILTVLNDINTLSPKLHEQTDYTELIEAIRARVGYSTSSTSNSVKILLTLADSNSSIADACHADLLVLEEIKQDLTPECSVNLRVVSVKSGLQLIDLFRQAQDENIVYDFWHHSGYIDVEGDQTITLVMDPDNPKKDLAWQDLARTYNESSSDQYTPIRTGIFIHAINNHQSHEFLRCSILCRQLQVPFMVTATTVESADCIHSTNAADGTYKSLVQQFYMVPNGCSADSIADTNLTLIEKLAASHPSIFVCKA